MGVLEAVSLFFVMLLLALIPSSSIALVCARSITHGVCNGIFVSLGIVLGDIIFVYLTIVGLSAIAETMGWLFLTIKYVGAVYLLWLGFSLLRSKPTTAMTVREINKNSSLLASFLAGLFVTLGDVKAILFYASLFPVFVNLEMLQTSDVAVIMLITLFAVGGIKSAYAFFSSRVVTISKKTNLEGKVKKLTGVLMIGSASYLIIKG